jgi:uncharacterized membrane protein
MAILNPFFWKQPLQAFQVSLRTRSTLTEQQLADHGVALGMEKSGPLLKAAGVIAQTYIMAPQIQEVGNYQEELSDSSEQYLNNPLHVWSRGWIVGGFFLVLSLTGFILSLRGIRDAQPEQRRNQLVWIFSSLSLFLILLAPLPWQRYTVPLLPFATYWTAAGLLPIFRTASSSQ